MTQLIPLSLAYQICSKICHDISAPLGAISMGFEMLNESSVEENMTLSLLNESIQSTVNKLNILRCLFGFGGSEKYPSLEDVRKTLSNSIQTEKHVLHWNIPETVSIQGDAARLLLAVSLLAIEGCPRSGVITIHPDFSITALGTGVGLPLDIQEILTKKDLIEKPEPRQILATFSTTLAHSLQTHIVYNKNAPDEFRLSFSEQGK